MRYCFVISILVLLISGSFLFAQNDRIDYNNQQLFLSGANIAWINFARDIGPGSTAFDSFAEMFLDIHDHGGNAMRFWLHINGANTPEFDNTGKVIGPGQDAVSDLQQILDLAWEREVGLILCLWSFDMMRIKYGSTITDRSRLMLTDTTYTNAYIQNALIPIVEALQGHPGIITWEIFNEPEGMSSEFGWSFNYHVPMSEIQRFINLCAAAIHKSDPQAKVTNGAWSFISQTDINGSIGKSVSLQQLTVDEIRDLEQRFALKYGEHLSAQEILRPFQLAQSNYNYYSDERLITAGGDSTGYLDFYTVHYYDWAGIALSPFHQPYSHWELDKPLVVAEFWMEDVFGISYSDFYGLLFDTGYAGSVGWDWGSGEPHRSRMLAGMQYLWDNHQQDVDVDGIAGAWPIIAITQPDDGAQFPDSSDIFIEAQATDSDGSIIAVEFFQGETFLEADSTAPYVFNWMGVRTGRYILKAKVTDNDNHVRISKSVTIIVGEPPVTRYEAEDAVLSGGPTVITEQSASNDAYVKMDGSGSITWNQVNVTTSGEYDLTIGFRLPFSEKTQYLYVNGNYWGEVVFDGAVNVWLEKTVAVNLISGNNIISIEEFWGYMHFDYIDITDSSKVLPSGIILSFTADPAFIEEGSGESSELTWLTSPGSIVTLDGILVDANGLEVVKPDCTTDYTLIAHGEQSDTSVVSITVMPAGDFNLALNKEVRASTTEQGTNVASHAVDGDPNTRWSSEYSDPQWIYVDLSEVYSIQRVVLNWEFAYGKSYQIQVSNDAERWSDIYTTTTGDGEIDNIDDLSGSGRYVRIFGTERATQWGYSLWEIEIYGIKDTSAVDLKNVRNILPTKFSLHQNYPNPFNPETNIQYELPRSVAVTFDIYDTMGRKITVLVDKKQPAGYYQVTFNAHGLASGIYYYRLRAGSYSNTRRMILLK
jgi:hypothetical protein